MPNTDHGLERTDLGKLGSGIYLSDFVRASIKYISPSEMEGTQLLVVYDVALESCLDLYEHDYLLNNAPSAYDSVHGVHKTADIPSDFEAMQMRIFQIYKNWSSGQTGKSCPSERCLYQGNRLCSTDLLFVDLKFLSMEDMSLERMALGISVYGWEKILTFDVDCLINNFLIRKGIRSLGPNGKEELLQLMAALVLQFIRCTKK